MKKKNKTEKEKKKKPHSPASRAGRPNLRDQTTGPALHFSPSAGPREAASRPGLTARGPRSQPARLPASLAAAAAGPHASASPPAQCRLLHAHASTAARPEANSAGRSGPGGHARGMALSPWRHAHATTCRPLDVKPAPPIALGLHPPFTELHGRARL